MANSHAPAYATVESDIFKPTKYGGKYTVTLIPGTANLSYQMMLQRFFVLTDQLYR